jgi:hypothetical protein
MTIVLAIWSFLKGLPGLAKIVYRMFPPRVWLAVGAVIFVCILAFLHGQQVGRALSKARAEGAAAADARWQKLYTDQRDSALAWKQKAESEQTNITNVIRESHDEEIRRIDNVADALRLRGPGKAVACTGQVDHAGVPASASGPGASSWKPDASGPDLPAEQWAAVPWQWLVQRAQQCDLNRAEALAWREWHSKQSMLRQK